MPWAKRFRRPRWPKGSARLKLEHDGTQTGSGYYREFRDAVATDIPLTRGSQEMRVVAVGGEVFLRLPTGAGLDPARPWVKVTAGGRERASTILGRA